MDVCARCGALAAEVDLAAGRSLCLACFAAERAPTVASPLAAPPPEPVPGRPPAGASAYGPSHPPGAAPGYGPSYPPGAAPGYGPSYPPGGTPAYPPGAYGQGGAPPPAYPGYGPPLPMYGGYPGAPAGQRPAPTGDLKRGLLVGGGALAVCLVAAGVLIALRKPPPLEVYAYASDSGSAFVFDVSTEARASVEVKGVREQADEIGHATVRVPRKDFKAGSEDVEVVATLDGGKRRGAYHVTVHREIVQPSLRLAPLSAAPGLTDVPCSGPYCLTGVSVTASGSLTFRIEAPDGTRLELRGQPVLVDAKVRETPYVLDIQSELGAVPVAMLDTAPSAADPTLPATPADAKVLSLPVKVTSPDDVEARGAIDFAPSSVRSLGAALFAGVVRGPVRLGEGLEPSKDRAAVRVYAGTQELKVYGTGKLRDVALVLVDTHLEGRDGGVCGPYSEYGFGGNHAPRTLVDSEVVAYDRRTGKETARQRFLAQAGECPSSIYVTNGQMPQITEHASEAQIDAWAKALLARPR